MAAIPAEKAPINEEGAEYHKQQMVQQLPAHDFEESLADELNDEEREKMMQFKKKRDEEDSGQGMIKEQTEIVSSFDVSIYLKNHKFILLSHPFLCCKTSDAFMYNSCRSSRRGATP